jgi:hypothetical protein
MASYRVVWPDGSAQDLVGSNEPKLDEEIVTADGQHLVARYVRRKEPGGEPTVYCDPAPASRARPRKLIFVVVRGSRYPLTLAETAELADRTSRFGGGATDSPATAIAVGLERLLREHPGEAGETDLLESEESALRWVIYQWLIDVGARRLPDRILDLRRGLYVESEDAPA